MINYKIFFLALSSLLLGALTYAGEGGSVNYKKELKILCPGKYSLPLHDIAIGEDNIWWSYGNIIVKTDLKGKKVSDIKIKKGIVEGLFYQKGKVYAVQSLRKNEAVINIFNAATSAREKKIVLTADWDGYSPRDISCDGSFFYFVGVAKRDKSRLPVFVYDKDFKFIKKITAKTGEYTTGAKNITLINNKFYLSCSSRRPNNVLFKFDANFKHVKGYRTYCEVGVDKIAPGYCFVGRTILTKKDNRWCGFVRSAIVSNTGIDVIGKVKLQIATYSALPDNYLKTRVKCKIPRSRNPYSNVNWEKDREIMTSSHMHGRIQRTHDNVYERGVRFVTYSNYYPAMPHYPIKNGKFTHHWSGVTDGLRRYGKPVNKSLNLLAIISAPDTGWLGEVSPSLQKKYLNRGSMKVYKHTFPKDILEAPNAEHYGFKSVRLHITNPGSTFSSGTFDASNKFRLAEHGFTRGVGMLWPEVFDAIFKKLIFPDGGGVIINHPKRSHTKFKNILAMLDFDSRVLGIEIYNSGYSWNEELWDKILATGRQCYGFFVPDHGPQKGRNWVGMNILLVSKPTVHECLKAYRKGNFYGAVLGKGIKFTSIKSDNKSIKVKTDKAQKIEFITEKGIVKTVLSNEAKYILPKNKNGKPDLVFVRVRAFEFADNKDYSKNIKKYGGYLGKGEVIFSQPVMYKQKR
jgi:hypothetical protein